MGINSSSLRCHTESEIAMNKPSQEQKAALFLSFHSSGTLLILPNVWDPIGARILEVKGYSAVATSSSALSASLGYQDGEKIKSSTVIEHLRRMVHSVDLPVTADIEAGYAGSLGELQETAAQVIDAGVVGINIEDSLKGTADLRSVAEQCQRISAVRQVADIRGFHLVINARTDCFMLPYFPDKGKAMDEALVRAKAYTEAGADCIYPIGPGDEQTVRILRDKIESPINILASVKAAPLSVLQEIGVNRVSFGPFLFRACLRKLVDTLEGLRSNYDYSGLSNMVSPGEIVSYLSNDSE
jgi:2-methylisocitrate lyase-like PEP mutase family enzyme